MKAIEQSPGADERIYPSDDNTIVFTLEEALSEIRALRSQKRALVSAARAMAAYVEPHPSWESDRRLGNALAAVERIKPLCSETKR